MKADERRLVIGVALGGPLVAVGIIGALVDADRTKPVELAAWVVGAALVHDLVVVPLTLAIGTLLRRWLPPSVRGPVQWAVATSAVLVVVAWPFVQGWGRAGSVPSLLPRNYAVGLAWYVAAVWLTAAATAVAVRLRASRARRQIV